MSETIPSALSSAHHTDTQFSIVTRSEVRPSDPNGPTGMLAAWLAETKLSDIPAEVVQRAKHLLLDGVACLMVGSHLPWSELAVGAITEFDRGGQHRIAGWGGLKSSAFNAALLNSSFIQGFELDDYFPAAPLHSNAIILPACLPIVEIMPAISGADFLRSLILGYETGTRVGLSLHGPEMLSRGWHSGVVFGGPAAAAAAGSLMQLTAAQLEDALGIASTQACGLMSAQYESMVKRMQHGFAARNGLLAASLASRGYIGIKKIFEREYGGFLQVFGEGHNPDPTQITKDLGSRWMTCEIAIKPYAAMAGLHAAIDASLLIRENRIKTSGRFTSGEVNGIFVEVSEAAYAHGGFPIQHPLEPITAQMSLRYSTAVSLLDGSALVTQFANHRINSEDVWNLIPKITIRHAKEFDEDKQSTYKTRVTVQFKDGVIEQRFVETPLGGDRIPLSNAAVVERFHDLASNVISTTHAATLENFILSIEQQRTLGPLLSLLSITAKCALQ
ncbi:MAG: MmgE/PrpD family protein [Acidobacteriaceae bacterium]